MKREHRNHFAEIRATTVGDQSGVTLHAIKPGLVDDYGSLWMPDTFDASLAERMPTLCWSHDWGEPLGPAVDYRTSDDGPEVDFVFSDFDAVPTARRAHAQVSDGTIADCSVGFSDVRRRDPTDDEKAQYPGIREVIEQATLDEISLVLRGAVPGAKVLAVRSRQEGVAFDDVIELARRKAAGDITLDEARAALELLEGREVSRAPAGGAPPGDDVELEELRGLSDEDIEAIRALAAAEEGQQSQPDDEPAGVPEDDIERALSIATRAR